MLLLKYLQTAGYNNIRYTEKFVIAEGEIPVCLIAHMDTVFIRPPFEFFYDSQKKVLWAPYGSGFDDRAGIYAIIQCLEAGLRPHIIFTDEEEKGGIGARDVIHVFPDCPFNDCRCLIQLDRANEIDSVFYDCDNQDFEKYINKFGFKTNWGTFSDISTIAPAWEIAAVNLSIGYVDEHTSNERLYCKWCDKTIEKVKRILIAAKNMKSYAYIPIKYNAKYWDKVYGYGYGAWWNDYPREDDFEEEEEEDRYSRCLMCGGSITEKTRKIIPDKVYPYAVCNKCFAEYYDENSVYKGGFTDQGNAV